MADICVLVTRPEGQADKLKKLLEEQGARVEIQPAIAILPPDSWTEVDDVINRLEEYAYAVFSSVNGVNMFLSRLVELGRGVDALNSLSVAAVGASTAAELERRGVRVQIVPDEYRAENLADAIVEDVKKRSDEQKPVKAALFRASRGREILKPQLESVGIETTQVVIYKSEDVLNPNPEIVEKLNSGAIDWVALTSSAIAQSTINMLGDALRKAKIACISPITAAIVEKNGFTVDAVAEPYTMEGLVEAIMQCVIRNA
ncbi:MAG: uroporphyrinogen-III synthase [Thermoguttaceae bacterium]|nr:uroporphyrinogen-III synthase [Thermoguttaceae bacterium]